MPSAAIMRVWCVDAPCQGLTYADLNAGRVLFGDVADNDGCIYRISADETIDALAGHSQPPTSTTAGRKSRPRHPAGRMLGGRGATRLYIPGRQPVLE
jgi:hypothetical protein